jgi:hypothetical protein
MRGPSAHFLIGPIASIPSFSHSELKRPPKAAQFRTTSAFRTPHSELVPHSELRIPHCPSVVL